MYPRDPMSNINKQPAIILAVNKSNVYSNRCFIQLGTKTLLEYLRDRLLLTKYISKIILCTSINSEDNSLAKHAMDIGIGCFRGDFDNVIKRLLNAYNADDIQTAFIFRGDSPLVDPHFCDKLYKLHISSNPDYSYSEHLLGLPYGTGCEIVNKIILKRNEYEYIHNSRSWY